MLTQIVHKLDNHIDPIILSYGGGGGGPGTGLIYTYTYTHTRTVYNRT